MPRRWRKLSANDPAYGHPRHGRTLPCRELSGPGCQTAFWLGGDGGAPGADRLLPAAARSRRAAFECVAVRIARTVLIRYGDGGRFLAGDDPGAARQLRDVRQCRSGAARAYFPAPRHGARGDADSATLGARLECGAGLLRAPAR